MFLKSLATALGLVATLGLVSCQKETLSDPQPQATARADDASAKFVGNSYLLVKHNGNALLYNRSGALSKINYGPNSYLTHTDYTYGFQTITAVSHIEVQDRTDTKAVFQLDGNGRCVEAEVTSYVQYSFGSVSFTTTWKYEYDAQGHLKKSYNKANAAEHVDYLFDAAGDLVKVTNYGQNGLSKSEVKFGYEQPAGDIFADKYPLNPTNANLYDTHLRIFGKASKHLVKRLTAKTLPSNQVDYDWFYSYTLNGDGYVKQQQQFNVANAALIATVPYEYQVTVSF